MHLGYGQLIREYVGVDEVVYFMLARLLAGAYAIASCHSLFDFSLDHYLILSVASTHLGRYYRSTRMSNLLARPGSVVNCSKVPSFEHRSKIMTTVCLWTADPTYHTVNVQSFRILPPKGQVDAGLSINYEVHCLGFLDIHQFLEPEACIMPYKSIDHGSVEIHDRKCERYSSMTPRLLYEDHLETIVRRMVKSKREIFVHQQISTSSMLSMGNHVLRLNPVMSKLSYFFQECTSTGEVTSYSYDPAIISELCFHIQMFTRSSYRFIPSFRFISRTLGVITALHRGFLLQGNGDLCIHTLPRTPWTTILHTFLYSACPKGIYDLQDACWSSQIRAMRILRYEGFDVYDDLLVAFTYWVEAIDYIENPRSYFMTIADELYTEGGYQIFNSVHLSVFFTFLKSTLFYLLQIMDWNVDDPHPTARTDPRYDRIKAEFCIYDFDHLTTSVYGRRFTNPVLASRTNRWAQSWWLLVDHGFRLQIFTEILRRLTRIMNRGYEYGFEEMLAVKYVFVLPVAEDIFDLDMLEADVAMTERLKTFAHQIAYTAGRNLTRSAFSGPESEIPNTSLIAFIRAMSFEVHKPYPMEENYKKDMPYVVEFLDVTRDFFSSVYKNTQTLQT